jgi:hypothetical protein
VRNEDFFKTAFSIKSGEISDPILLGSNVMVLSLAEEKAAESEMCPLPAQLLRGAVEPTVLHERYHEEREA